MSTSAASDLEGPFSPRYRFITVGAVVLVFISAFENLAVTTVMPLISAEFDGGALYAVAFAAPLAASVLGMVVAGILCDRDGPRLPLVVSIVLFVAGLVVAGTAVGMPFIVAGRLVQGLGGGAITVCLYVIVARIYPFRLQPRLFGLFSAAWVVPALVGPFIAGVVGDTVGWRWVFLGVVALVLPASAMIAPAMRMLNEAGTNGAAETSDAGHDGTLAPPRPAWPVARTLWALVLAVAVLALSVSADLDGVAGYALAAGSLALALIALRPLLPPGVLRARRGLPSIVATRMLIAGGFFAAEIYLPYLLTSQHGLSPALAGLALTASGVAWGATSLFQSRFDGRLAEGAGVPFGAAAVVLAIGTVLVTALFALPAWVAIAGWAVSGAGMGLIYPRLSALLLQRSAPSEQGFNSAALNIADGAGPAMSLAVAGILFQSIGGAGATAFAGVFALGLLCAVAALVVSPRALSR